MSELAPRLFVALADAAFHSGQELARRHGVTRSAIWKGMRELRSLGLEVEAQPRRGYRLAHAVSPLDEARVLAGLTAAVRERLHRGECRWLVGSTNEELLQRTPVAPGTFDYLAAEIQTAGRGRRGRTWLAPPGAAICLSLSWSFAGLPAHAGALGLAVGVCVLRALRSFGVARLALKWPNDLVSHMGVSEAGVSETRKVGGILIELRSEAAGPAQVVVGIGLNVHLSESLRRAVARSGTRAAALADLDDALPERNALLAGLICACVQELPRFEREGLDPFLDDWRAADALRDQPVTVLAAHGTHSGVARGIDASGALLVDCGGILQRHLSGDVSVRPQP